MALLTDTSIRNLLVTTEEEWIQNQNEKLLHQLLQPFILRTKKISAF